MAEPRTVPSLESIEAYWDAKTAGLITVSGSPSVWFVVDPVRSVLALRVVADADQLRIDERRNVSAAAVDEGNRRLFAVQISVDRNLPESVAFLGSVADRIQLEGKSFNEAVARSLASYGQLLELAERMSEEQEIGLVAELATLLALARAGHGRDAVDMWGGPDGEEHDFRLPSTDLEVKCTRSERPAHWISGLTQLVPSNGRALHVLSVLVTAGTPDVGVRLPRLIDQVFAVVGESARSVEERIQSRYRAEDAKLYGQAWSLRQPPTLHLVDDAFPAVTPGRIAAVLAEPARVLDLRYRIDLTGMPRTALPFPPASFTLSEGV